MLKLETARKIGMTACIDKLGRDFVLANRNMMTSAYGESEDGLFCFVGVTSAQTATVTHKHLILDSQSQFQYRVSCNVDLQNGEPTFIECVLPSVSIT